MSNPLTEEDRLRRLAARTVFTTGQVARLCGVAARTVAKWCDEGRLGSYRIPSSDNRRIPRPELIRFLRAPGHSLPDTLRLFAGADHVLLIDPAPGGTAAELVAAVPALAHRTILEADSPFAAGILYHRHLPHVVACYVGPPSALATARHLATVQERPHVVAVFTEDKDPAAFDLAGVTAWVRLPATVAELARAFHRSTVREAAA